MNIIKFIGKMVPNGHGLWYWRTAAAVWHLSLLPVLCILCRNKKPS